MTDPRGAPPPDAPAGSASTFRPWRGLEDIAGMAAANAGSAATSGCSSRSTSPAMHHRYTPPRELGPAVGLHRRRAGRGDRGLRPGRVARPGRRRPGLRPDDRRRAGRLGARASPRRDRLGRGAACARSPPSTPRTAGAGTAPYAFGGDAELGRGARGAAATRPSAGTPRCSGRTWRTCRPSCPRRLRAPGAGERRAAGGPRDDRRRVREHWGEYGGRRPRDRGLGRGSPLPPRPGVVAWHGDSRPVRPLERRRARPDGSIRGMLERLATHPDHRRRGLARAAMAESLAAPARRRAPRAPTSASTRTTTTGRSPSTSLRLPRSRPAAPPTASRSRAGEPP